MWRAIRCLWEWGAWETWTLMSLALRCGKCWRAVWGAAVWRRGAPDTSGQQAACPERGAGTRVQPASSVNKTGQRGRVGQKSAGWLPMRNITWVPIQTESNQWSKTVFCFVLLEKKYMCRHYLCWCSALLGYAKDWLLQYQYNVTERDIRSDCWRTDLEVEQHY